MSGSSGARRVLSYLLLKARGVFPALLVVGHGLDLAPDPSCEETDIQKLLEVRGMQVVYLRSWPETVPVPAADGLDARVLSGRALPARWGGQGYRDDLQGLVRNGQARITVQSGLADDVFLR